MVPCRLTGRPFWEIYAFQDPPLWKAHIHALNHFDLDGGFELFGPYDVFSETRDRVREERVVSRRADGSFITQIFNLKAGTWHKHVKVYTADNPPGTNVLPEKLGLPPRPAEWEPLSGVKEWPSGLDLWLLIRKELGDRGVMGLQSGAGTCVLHNPEDIYAYHDDSRPFHERREATLDRVENRMKQIAAMDPKPDFLTCGGSGTLVWQSPKIFRELALPILKRVTELAAEIGIPTHVHSCGPQKELVKMAAEETMLTVIDPLEVPPMGDCDLADLKRRYGDRIVLKGNLHTTRHMLHGSPDEVRAASKKAIEDGGAGGGFILSTGDQCGRDTPDENIRAMVEACERFGRY